MITGIEVQRTVCSRVSGRCCAANRMRNQSRLPRYRSYVLLIPLAQYLRPGVSIPAFPNLANLFSRVNVKPPAESVRALALIDLAEPPPYRLGIIDRMPNPRCLFAPRARFTAPSSSKQPGGSCPQPSQTANDEMVRPPFIKTYSMFGYLVP
jgi:hypothetical protein